MRDSCGTGGQVRLLYVKRTNVAHRLPRGKRAASLERKSPTFKSNKDSPNSILLCTFFKYSLHSK
ncbi:hypothetical protein [Fictibacillus sp. UD]|uniref:hypothetical protein n=1 Tax=Fictibacillus sp. UD TaxID=3038777 RepID=UPI00374890DD